MAIFNGTLATNKVFASLFNMIISLQVFDTGISNLEGVYSSRRVDGTLYGDTKVYISTDALKSYEWSHSSATYNLLTQHRPPAPKEYFIRMGIYRQIPVTVDAYLTKQAFTDEGSFATFNGVVLSWMSKTKQVYEHTKFTSDIIVGATSNAKSLTSIDLAPAGTLDDLQSKIWKAQTLFKNIEDALKELNEPSREYNDAGFLRNYSKDDFDIIVPLGVMSDVTKFDVPFLYNPDDKPIFKEVHWKYFGTKNAAGGNTTATNNNIRSLIEKDYTVGGNVVHVFPGDLVPNSTAYAANETYTAKYTARPNIDSAFDVLLVHKRDFPIMSAFSVQTSFFNAHNLTTNNYLTFGHNPVEDAHIGEYALLKIAVDTSE